MRLVFILFSQNLCVEVQVTLLMSTFVAMESVGALEVCLILTGELERDLNVTVSTVSDTATGRCTMCHYNMLVIIVLFSSESIDYTPLSGFPVEFLSAPSQECVSIVIADDSVEEQSEEFEVVIDSPQADGAVSLGPFDRSTVVILDNGEIISCS